MASAYVEFDFEEGTPELLEILSTYPNVDVELVNAPGWQEEP